MPRITKKMKMEELKLGEERIAKLVMMCLGYSVSSTQNIVDEYGTRLVFGKEDNKKFLKWGDEPFRYREMKFDPVNQYQLTVQLFGQFIDQLHDPDNMNDYEVDDSRTESLINLGEIRTIVLRDGQLYDDGKQEKYVELGFMNARVESERYFCPTLGYIEIMLSEAGLLNLNEKLLRRVDELKNELEPEPDGDNKRSSRPRTKTKKRTSIPIFRSSGDR